MKNPGESPGPVNSSLDTSEFIGEGQTVPASEDVINTYRCVGQRKWRLLVEQIDHRKPLGQILREFVARATAV